MNTRSRRILPRQDRSMTPGGCAILAAIVGGLALLASRQPAILGFGLLIIVVSVIFNVEHRRLVRRLGEGRLGESICTFARSFDCRAVDTRIIRAAHEELQDLLGGSCPLRASDRFVELETTGVELDDIVPEIARRAGRSLDLCEENPHFHRLDTVADLVHFLDHQPMVEVA